uniref:Putative secreted protein n=1 Tax=Anopheles darlingi TaxID=43151 RepID=A0A2M4D4S5_ANODA
MCRIRTRAISFKTVLLFLIKSTRTFASQTVAHHSRAYDLILPTQPVHNRIAIRTDRTLPTVPHSIETCT